MRRGLSADALKPAHLVSFQRSLTNSPQAPCELKARGATGKELSLMRNHGPGCQPLLGWHLVTWNSHFWKWN